MANEKDRLGQKLHDAEAAREDQWARQHDAELLEQMRRRITSTLHCLKCGKTLVNRSLGTRQVYSCPDGHGAWMDAAVLESISRS